MALKFGRIFIVSVNNDDDDDDDEVVIRIFYIVDIFMFLILIDVNECEMFENVCEGGGLCVNT